jgi:hypothetical protein
MLGVGERTAPGKANAESRRCVRHCTSCAAKCRSLQGKIRWLLRVVANLGTDGVACAVLALELTAG